MNHLESALEAYMRKKVRSAMGGMLVKMAPTVSGMPDRMVLLPLGRIYLVELKADDGRLSPIQQHWHALAARLGTEVYVLRGRDEVDEWVREIAARLDPKSKKPPAYLASRPAVTGTRVPPRRRVG